jgi:imidazoleglycerol-phosphate dehydratase / histidinol-phosphatase
MKKRLLFIDRDGTIVQEPKNYQLDRFEDLIYYPEVFRFFGKITRKLNFEIVMVTNQDGLGTASHPEEQFWKNHNHIIKSFENEGIVFQKYLLTNPIRTKTNQQENQVLEC